MFNVIVVKCKIKFDFCHLLFITIKINNLFSNATNKI